jgi:hypothetical protein
MVYFANFGNNQCVRGSSSLQCGPEATGFYNGNFVSCFGWPYWTSTARDQGKSSWGKYIYQCDFPYVNTGKSNNSDLNYGSTLRWYGRPFSLNLDSGMGIANVGFYGSNPENAGTTSLGLTYMAGYKHIGVTAKSNAIGITATAAYSFTFASWRLDSASGTFLTSTATTNLYFNSTYGGQNFKDIKTFFASAS